MLEWLLLGQHQRPLQDVPPFLPNLPLLDILHKLPDKPLARRQ